MTTSHQTQWMHRNDLLRPGIYLSIQLWKDFNTAVAYENYQRGLAGEKPTSRTGIIVDMIKSFIEGRLAVVKQNGLEVVSPPYGMTVEEINMSSYEEFNGAPV